MNEIKVLNELIKATEKMNKSWTQTLDRALAAKTAKAKKAA
jgi:hypothetical protein